MKALFCCGGAVLALAGSASAQTLGVSITFDDLAGAYSGSTFSAVAVNQVNGLQSAMEASKLVGPGTGNASFQPGFITTAGTLSNFAVSLTVSNADGSNGALDLSLGGKV